MTNNSRGTEQLPVTSWYEAFIAEMEQRGARAHQISDQVATVHSHCLEAQENPQVLFGPPHDYARDLVPTPGAFRPIRWVHGLGSWAFMALCFTAPGAARWLMGSTGGATWFSITLLVLVVVAFCLEAALAGIVGARARWIPLLVLLCGLAMAWWRIPLDAMAPGWLACLITGTAVVAGLAAAWLGRRQRITDPVTGRPYALTSNQPTWLWLGLAVVVVTLLVVLTNTVWR
ncbi:hypothetical protein [Luteococcus peritonei]|uniref:Uncharacterized protein n=1 Tax=Luteococcus peritonei TaxID=88874 RepID=A0ABW4RTY9_9ACTN